MEEEKETGQQKPEDLREPAPGERGSLNEIERQLEECEKKRDDYLSGWQRARADFLNYKKEEAERANALMVLAQIELILKVLPILDSFDLAEKKLSAEIKEHPETRGLLRIDKQLRELLRGWGIEEMKSMGEKFNPAFHEAVEQIEAKCKESGVIVEEVQKGYTIQGRVIRAAKVKVAK